MKIMDDTDENRELLDNVSMEVVSPPFLMQRMEPSQLLSNELMPTHNSLVVEMNNSEYLPNVSYATDELLGHDLTDEDRNLAAALVAVQLVQQQKQQQLHENASTLASLVSQTQLDNDLTTDQTESRIDKPVIITNTFSIHDSLATLKKFDTITEEYTTDDVKEEYSIKNETEHDSTLHSDSENRNDAKTLIKKSLPHKKRITRKLKKPMGVLKKIHKCSGCEQTFITLEQLNSHTVTCHSVAIVVQQPLNQFSCQICGLICTDQLTFFEHLKSHYEPVNSPKPATQPPKNSLLGSLLSPLNCVNCGKNFRRQKTYETHIRDCHKLEDEFSEPEDLMEGIRGVVEANNRDSGEECAETDSKVWYGADTVTEHVCHLCGQVLTSDEDVCNHLHECKATLDPKIDDLQGRTRKKQRRKSGQLFCPHCDRVFSHRNSLMYHMRGHTGERPHQCDVCGKSFFAASALKVHMRLHSGDKPYKCEFCGRHFRQWGDLKYHCISIHSDEKQYQCEYCGKDFARKYSLIVHRRIHTGEKNYRCEFCGKTFRASSYLQNHRRIHTGEKPHPCEVCGKPFRVRSDMKRHLNTHTRRRGPGPASAPGRETTTIIKIQQDGNSAESIVPDQEDTLIEAGDELPPDGEEEADTEAGIAQESEDSIHYQRDPLETVRDGTNTLFSNGHQLFICYPSELSTGSRTIEAQWIQQSDR